MSQQQTRADVRTPIAPPRATDAATLGALFTRMSAGEVAAFDALFGVLYAPLCNFARTYVRSAHVAEELVEDLFLQIWADRERIRIQGSVASYLYAAVRHRALNHLKRLKVERSHIERVQRDEHWLARHGVNDAEERMRDAELAVRVREAIDQLPPRARQTYELYYQHHLSYAEIARVMGTSVKTVENQLSRSLKALWVRLKDVLE